MLNALHRHGLSLRQRTFVSFVVVLIPSVILAVASISGMRAIDRSVRHSRDAAITAIVATEFATRVAELDAGVGRFALTGTALDERDARNRLISAEAAFDAAIEQHGVSLGEARRFRDAFQRYEIAVKMIVDAVHQRFIAADIVKRTSTELANATSAVITRLLRDNRGGGLAGGVRLDEAMQASLVAATRYFASQNPADADGAKSYLQNLRDEMSGVASVAAEVPRLQRIADALPALAKNYEAGIDQQIGATDLYKQATRDHLEAVAELDAIADRLKVDNAAARDQAVANVDSVRHAVTLIDIITALVVLAAGIAIAGFASRSIAVAHEQAERLLSSLATMTQRLQSCRNDSEIADVVSRFAPQIWRRVPGALYVLSASENVMRAAASWNSPAGLKDSFAPIECWALRRGRSHTVRDVGHEVVCPHVDQHNVNRYSCLPLAAQGETLGMLYFETPMLSVEADGSNVSSNINIFAENIALALGNQRLREKLRDQSVHDPLTGLFNRRFLEEALELNIARAVRGGSSLSVIMGDIDLFKNFNDGFGHDAGDFVLKRIAELMQAAIRTGDIACRYGGEEFLLLLPGAELRDARERAEKVRKAIKSTEMIFRGQSLGAVTLSFGVAAFPVHAADGKSLITAADAAMYAAKNAGRDRVETASRSSGAEAPKPLPQSEDPSNAMAAVLPPSTISA